ncbi:MAG: hypothetical protein HN760_00805, partial [Microbacteriaceae bacterium]|nr:hypothetical protein [Microbacteriaceae bacterium]
MSRTPSPTSAQFPRFITWLGLLILGAGVTYGPMSSASASSTIATSSTAWSSAIMTTGVVGGGTSRDYLSGIEGWSGDAVSSLGVMGLEW